MPTETKPKFVHDCKSCIFLGHVVINDREADIYICPSHSGDERYDDVIYRHSDEGSDYGSTHPAYFGPLSSFGAVAVAMWTEWRGYDGYNWNGSLFKDGKFVMNLYGKG